MEIIAYITKRCPYGNIRKIAAWQYSDREIASLEPYEAHAPYYWDDEWHLTKEEAIAHAEKKRDAELKKLERDIKQLTNKKYTI